MVDETTDNGEGMTQEDVEESSGGKEKDGIAKLREENEKLVDRLKRLQAEFENYQKRVDKEREAWAQGGKEGLFRNLITLADEFDAATAHMSTSSEGELRSGIRLLQQKLMEILKAEDVEPMECLGRKFNPKQCDAVEMVEDEGDEGVVVKEMRRGYVCKGKVLRHALVGVSKKPSDGENQKK